MELRVFSVKDEFFLIETFITCSWHSVCTWNAYKKFNTKSLSVIFLKYVCKICYLNIQYMCNTNPVRNISLKHGEIFNLVIYLICFKSENKAISNPICNWIFCRVCFYAPRHWLIIQILDIMKIIIKFWIQY